MFGSVVDFSVIIGGLQTSQSKQFGSILLALFIPNFHESFFFFLNKILEWDHVDFTLTRLNYKKWSITSSSDDWSGSPHIRHVSWEGSWGSAFIGQNHILKWDWSSDKLHSYLSTLTFYGLKFRLLDADPNVKQTKPVAMMMMMMMMLRHF